MNTWILIVVAIIFALIAGWFYGQHGEVAAPVSVENTEVDYEASEISAVQTNDAGETEYQLNAQSLTHNPTTNQDELNDITMDWTPTDTEQRYKITAGKAVINQETGDIELSGGFKLISLEKQQSEQSTTATEDTATADPENASNANASANNDANVEAVDLPANITITGESLQGNTKTRAIASQQPVHVVQQENRFDAASMTGNLEIGDYQFEQVSVSYTPSERQDQALF